jgi:hypothetical protein
MKGHGIDRGAHFGGKLEGNSCRKLMGVAVDLVNRIEEHVLVLPVEQRVVGTDDDIREVIAQHRVLLLNLDGLMSALRTVRFHVTPQLIIKTELYLQRVLELWRHLEMSVTPKLRYHEDHVIYFAAVRDFAKREKSKSKPEVMNSQPTDARGRLISLKKRRILKLAAQGC